MESIAGAIVLLAAALLAAKSQAHWLPNLAALILLIHIAGRLLFGPAWQPRAFFTKWRDSNYSKLLTRGFLAFWLPMALGVFIFGSVAGDDFLVPGMAALAACLAPWLAGACLSWTRKRHSRSLGILFGAALGLAEGSFLLARWEIIRYNMDWFSFGLLVASIILGGLLGLWGCAQGRSIFYGDKTGNMG
ncbi:MAG: hypothetical protein ACM3X6_08365 [Patescibacteria group bacterium]